MDAVKYGLLIDYEFCSGCQTCEVACKEEHDLPVGKWGIRVFDDGPWQKDDADDSGNCFNWNKIPVPTDLCDFVRRSCGSWEEACMRSPLPSILHGVRAAR